MTAASIAEQAAFDIVDDSAQFFAPVSSDLLTGMLGQYAESRRQIAEIAQIAQGALGGSVRYFIAGNVDPRERRYSPAVDKLFDEAGAVRALNAEFWQRALGCTDVFEVMPKARRDEWTNSIMEMTTPDFTADAVRPTIEGLLVMRSQFFAERVDGIFRGLSGEHVTNAPEAFGKRMILAGMADAYGHYGYQRAGLINDLRCVIAKFMGRGEPKWNSTQALLTEARRDTGQWLVADGGALRIRVYLKGTAHLEVHPEMAWRLNCVLAQLYPLAIPAEFRAKPKKRLKDFVMMSRPLPFAVLDILPGFERYGSKWRFPHNAKDNAAAYAEAVRVVESIGGTVAADGVCSFDYPVEDVITEIRISGCVPDRVAHQFYPTPESIARVATEMAQIGEADTVLEPSAGQGDLAAFLPKERTRCVEISALHCAVLKAKGFDVVQADFIAWAEKTTERFDRVVMNPPFSEGRAKAHVEAAATLLKPGGRLIAVLPASMRGKPFLDGFDHEWSRVFAGEFAGTSVSVAIAAMEAA